MRRTRGLPGIALVSCLGLAAAARAQEPASPPGEAMDAAHRAEIRALLERVATGDLKQRESARERLIEIGDEAVPFLEEAAKQGDTDRADAAKEVLATLRWKLPKNLEALVGKPLEDYSTLTKEQRAFGLARVAENLRQAAPLVPFLANVARFDPDPELRTYGLSLFIELTPRGDPVHDRLVLEALEAEVPRKELHLWKARMYSRLGKKPESLKEARLAYAGLGKTDNPRLSLFLAETFVVAGAPGEALPILDAIAEKNPNDLEVQALLGEAYLLAGDKAKGDEILARVAKANLESPTAEKEVLLRTATAYIEAGRLDDAGEVLRRALQKLPYDQDVNVAVAELDMAQGRLAPALARLVNEARYTKRASPEFDAIKKLLARFFQISGEPDVASDADLLEDARRGRPLAKARLAAGRFLLARGLTEEAVRCFREAAVLDPGGIEARVRLGDALRRLGRDDDAKKVYEAARALAPKNDQIGERLRALALGTAADGVRVIADRAGDILSWDRRLLHDELTGEPEAIVDAAPPPIVAAGKVLFVPAGSLTVVGLEVNEGLPAFRARLEPPASETIDASLIGLEVAGLVPVPAAALAAKYPARARDGTPLAGVLVNEWVRAANRSFRKSRLESVLLYLVDPRDGKVLDRSVLLDEPVASGAAPVARGSRCLVVTEPGENRANLVLVDLVARRARWKQELDGGPVGRPLFAGDLLVVSTNQGIYGFGAEGSSKLSFAGAIQTRVASDGAALWFAEAGALKRLPLDGSAVKEVASAPGGEAFSGEPAVVGTQVLCGTRGGVVRAYDPASGKVGATMPLDRLDRAAQRTLFPLGARAFALNGSQDAFADEVAALLALDPSDLAIVWRRPVDRGAVAGTGEGMIVACSGSVRSPSGVRVTAARPGAPTVDARPRFLAEMRAAAEDALASGELEVGSVIARRFIVQKGGLELASVDELAFLARALALSNRADDAEAMLEVARARDPSPAGVAKLEKLRADLKLQKPEPDPTPAPRAPGPGREKPGDKPAGDKPGGESPSTEKPGEKPAPGDRPAPGDKPADEPAEAPPGGG